MYIVHNVYAVVVVDGDIISCLLMGIPFDEGPTGLFVLKVL